MKVLVVKADEGHASCLSTFLKQLGDDVMTATDCLSALRVAAAFRPDVVFTGLTLPRLDGWELTRRLRTMPALARTRIYALTAWNCDEAILESQAAGMDYHFAVPALLESWLLVHEAQAISPRQAEQAAFSLAQQVVLECFARKGSDNRFCNRKYLLAKCACARRLSHKLRAEDLRVIRRAERLADGEIAPDRTFPIPPLERDVHGHLRLCLLTFPGSIFDLFAQLRDCADNKEAEALAQLVTVDDVFGPPAWRPACLHAGVQEGRWPPLPCATPTSFVSLRPVTPWAISTPCPSSPTPSKTPAATTPPSWAIAAARDRTSAAAGWSICFGPSRKTTPAGLPGR